MEEIEIICIDDGSTDSSGRIADEYCNTDEDGNGNQLPLIRVIHTNNRGLSAARNRGIDEAWTEWLMFVDSDDWVEQSFCEIPWRVAVENKADLVIFQSDNWKNGIKVRNKNKDTHVGQINEYTAHDLGGATVWNKLYRKKLFNFLQYPEGRVYEDYAITAKVVHNAKTILLISECLYHYIFRRNSISHTVTVSNRRDQFVFMQDRYFFLSQNGYPIERI